MFHSVLKNIVFIEDECRYIDLSAANWTTRESISRLNFELTFYSFEANVSRAHFKIALK